MDFGSDFNGYLDLDPLLTFIEGDSTEAQPNSTRALTQALARRLLTPRGGLFYNQNYGIDVRDFISSTIDQATAAQMIAGECRQDERVNDCFVTISVLNSGNDQIWNITINCTTSTGDTLQFVLSVNSVTVTLLNSGT